jgi:thiamine pyrophosphate-dependent acetolactate synthase large subunit-like protein
MNESAPVPHSLDRRAVVHELLRERGAILVVSGLGGTSWDVAAVGDDPRNFYLWGGMGGAVAVGLGLALAQPGKRVLVITGDGEMLMGIGSLATVAAQQPSNLAVVVIDNERYGETGGQLTHSAYATDLAVMARGAGLARAQTLHTLDEVGAFRHALHSTEGPLFAVVKVAAPNATMVLPPRDGVLLKQRFRVAVLNVKA